MRIAIEGCAHGELETIYSTLHYLEEKEGFKIDLLICCGDFQASRNEADLLCMAVPPKYSKICSFYKYYTGDKTAPILTIFIGGNHEASNHLQELPYGGWVAPNIYYLGYAGVVNIAGVRIGGLSGIYKPKDYMRGHFEHAPYNDNTKRSVYHIRNLEVFRLKQLSGALDVFLSHDWPSGIWEYGDKAQLIRFKPFFERDMESGTLGSKPTEELLHHLKPDYWFSAHLHCKFAAMVPHSCGKTTRFLALDKCLPHRRFLQIVDVPHDSNLRTEISYDLEWLTIMRLTNHLLSVKSVNNYMPGPNGKERWCFKPTEEEKSDTLEIFGENLVVPHNFEKTVEGYAGRNLNSVKQPQAISNPQTVLFCKKLGVDDPLVLILNLDVSINDSFDGATDLSVDRTFVDSEIFASSPVQKKMVLNLPKPLNDEVPEVEEPESTEKTPQIVENVDEETAETSSSKKFKRRNASIYQNEND